MTDIKNAGDEFKKARNNELDYGDFTEEERRLIINAKTVFANQGHSGGSASFVIGSMKGLASKLFSEDELIPDSYLTEITAEIRKVENEEVRYKVYSTLALLMDHKPISPLTGDDDEWIEVSDGLFQNKRCSTVFKDNDVFNGQAYDIDGRFKGYPNVFHDSWSYWGVSGSMVKLVEFPYTPKSEKLHYHSEGSKILLEEEFDTKHTERLWHQLIVCGIDPEHNTINNEIVFMTKEVAEKVMEHFHQEIKHKRKLGDRYSFYSEDDSLTDIDINAHRLVGLLGYEYQQTEDGCYLIRGIKHEFRLAEVLMPNAHYQKWISLSRTVNSINTGPESHDILYAWVLEPVTPDHCKKDNHKDYLYVDRLTDKIGQLRQYEQSLRTGVRQDIFVMIGGDTDDYLYRQRRKYGFAHPKRKMNRKFDEGCTEGEQPNLPLPTESGE